MVLQILPTLLGDALSGQHIMVEMSDGKSHDFIYSPHTKYISYAWLLSSQDSGMTIEQLFPALKATWKTPWVPSWYTVYIDHKHPIAINSPLYLRAVPGGLGIIAQENSTCLGTVIDLSIQ